jgi:heme A synthase
MITRALGLVTLLTILQLAQGIAFNLKLVEGELFTLSHVGLGFLTFLILLGAAYSARRSGHASATDISFALAIYVLQGVFGLVIFAEGPEPAKIIHLFLSFFVVAANAAALSLSAVRRG